MSSQEQVDPLTSASKLNVLGFCLTFVPGSWVLFISHDLSAHWLGALARCAVFGPLGGWLFGLGRTPARAGVVGGFIAALGGTLLPYVVLGRREWVYNFELFATWAVGVLPGLYVYTLLCPQPEEPSPEADGGGQPPESTK